MNGGGSIDESDDNIDGGDCKSKFDCGDEKGGDGGISNDDDGVDGDDGFDTKGGEERTETATDDFLECNRSSKMEMRVGLIR